MKKYLTVPEVALVLGESTRRVRCVVDRLGSTPVIGQTRAIPVEWLPAIKHRLLTVHRGYNMKRKAKPRVRLTLD